MYQQFLSCKYKFVSLKLKSIKIKILTKLSTSSSKSPSVSLQALQMIKRIVNCEICLETSRKPCRFINILHNSPFS